ncbi:MAG TPA: glutamate-cysteine ligase family protein [Polyangiales bacterium]|nr:glutamate-cysteine ligase family protein [Polyangiales bacterium]
MLAPFHDALKPASAWKVGTEAEKFGLLTDSFAPIPYEGSRGVHAVLEALAAKYGWQPESEYKGGDVIALKRGLASITLEPGGQLELSGAPFQSIHDTAEEWDEHLREIHEIGSALGITWLGLGFHPFAAQADLPWVPKLRYGVMREYLPQRGGKGLDMMRRTCTVQANLDYSSEADAMRKLRVSLALSPVLTAMFANSPFYEGAISGERTHRGLVWLDTDPDRTGLLPFLWESDASFARYVEWALDVPMFLVKRESKVVHNTGQTFRAFMRDGYGGTHATTDDWVAHLGTLFPEVRLKRTIELRGADSLSAALTPALGAFAKGLYYDDAALRGAEVIASKLSFAQAEGSRREIAQRGLAAELAGQPVGTWASELVTLAREGLLRLAATEKDPRGDETRYLAPLAELVSRGETPADAMLRAIDPDRALAPQVVELARL